MTDNLIMVPCEGSGCPPAVKTDDEGRCSMCGDWVALDYTTRHYVTDHERPDFLAMLKRGDFG